MRLDRYLARTRIIDIKSKDLKGALAELLQVATKVAGKELNAEALLSNFVQRESVMTTYLGNGVAMPHLRLKMKKRYIFAVGVAFPVWKLRTPRNTRNPDLFSCFWPPRTSRSI